MADKTEAPEVVSSKTQLVIPQGFPEEVYKAVQKGLKPDKSRAIVFEREKQRNATFIQKGLSKPGSISYDTLRRAANSVHVARICINALKEKITKTKWVIKATDPSKKVNDEEKGKVEQLLRHPNRNSETFRTLLDKMLEDLLVLDAVSIEKTRYPNGELAELYFVDSATIRPVFDEYGNQDVDIPLKTSENGGNTEMLPVSYLQILNNSQYGGPESGDIIAAWPKKDMIHFHMHPQGSMEGFGYGLSPIEGVLSVVANLLNADNYNSTYFEEGSFPPIVLHLAGQISQRDAEAFREYMYQEMTGNFHRPAFMAGGEKMEVIDLKSDSNRDMQFMEYTIWLAKLMAAAYGLSPQDIGITDSVGSKNVAETQKDISQAMGYGSILALLTQVINEQIIDDFGFEDIEFEWVAPDTMDPQIAGTIYDQALKNGTMTVNEVREKIGETPFDEWADQPAILTAEGYKPLEPEAKQKALEDAQENMALGQGEKPVEEDEKQITKMKKSIYTIGNHKTWADDRGFSQPFIWMEVLSGLGQVIKPPVAVNLQSQELEIALTSELADRGLNVIPVEKKSYVEVVNMLRSTPDVLAEFEKYVTMTPEYDSEKWRAKLGGSRKFPYYLVSSYVDGYALNNPLLVADMKRDPESYIQVAKDLARLVKVEKELLLGDRRADQYIIGHDKRAYGIDYQFSGDKERWERTKGAVTEVLKNVPELFAIFNGVTTKKTLRERLKSIVR